jgi:hypothetical protein
MGQNASSIREALSVSRRYRGRDNSFAFFLSFHFASVIAIEIGFPKSQTSGPVLQGWATTHMAIA